MFAVALGSFISSFIMLDSFTLVKSPRVKLNTVDCISPFFNSPTVYEID